MCNSIAQNGLKMTFKISHLTNWNPRCPFSFLIICNPRYLIAHEKNDHFHCYIKQTKQMPKSINMLEKLILLKLRGQRDILIQTADLSICNPSFINWKKTRDTIQKITARTDIQTGKLTGVEYENMLINNSFGSHKKLLIVP